MSSLLATAALTVAGLLPQPVPLLPSADAGTQAQAPARIEVFAQMQAADGRLKRGCKDYQYTYVVTAPSADWSFDITLTDRHGKGVNSQSLLGPNDPMSGVLTYQLCRWATVPGLFTLTGTVVSYDNGGESRAGATETFRLRRRNP